MGIHFTPSNFLQFTYHKKKENVEIYDRLRSEKYAVKYNSYES